LKIKLPRFDLTYPRLGLAAWRNRLVFHGVFLLLALATVALAVTLLREEKQRAYQRYAEGFGRSLATLGAKLRHPTGQLALLNPAQDEARGATPLLLPFAAIDFDDPQKARSAVEMAGCARQYANGASLCLAVGSNAYAGGFVYAVGALGAGPLVARERGRLELGGVDRARVRLAYRGEVQQWLAPFEAMAPEGFAQRGRLTGFATAADDLLAHGTRPDRDFRGWLWREGPCLGGGSDPATCARRTMFSLRLPVAALRDALMRGGQVVWPPPDLALMALRITLVDAAGRTRFDSAAEAPQAPLTLQGLVAELQGGEVLRIERDGRLVAALRGEAEPEGLPSPWLTRLIARLPLRTELPPRLVAHDAVDTPLGRYELTLSGDPRSVDQALSAVATRVSWLVGGMLLAIFLAWLVIALGLMRRIARLTRRAAAVSYNIQPERLDAQSIQRLGELDVTDLRGRDELGILAGTIADLLARAKLALRREQLRAEHERDMWHAVGHEIMSPLQALLALHADADAPSRRYLLRMQQAVRVLYGTASPSEALASAQLAPTRLDLVAFVAELARNAAYAGIDDVVLAPGPEGPVFVHADAYSLEDVVTHVLANADRHRAPGSPITLRVARDGAGTELRIHNRGAPIRADMLERIFDYGVSGDAAPDAAASGGVASSEHRGQGLFVARSYLAKMDGRIAAVNADGGVSFVISLTPS